ncbi:MAG: membrane protein insertase YidC [Acidimicrobiales bacterium]
MFQLLAGMLAFFYGLVPNYAVAIALLTLTVMLVLSPLTLKSTRSMLAMQKLQPEMKALQQKHKGGDRQKLNEEMIALYREHKVNPVAGCLPLILQMPVFLVMYQVINGLTRKGDGGGFDPKYLDEGTRLYRDLRDAGGEMNAFGIDLAKRASEGHESFLVALPFFVIVALVVFSQYMQTRQTMSRSTAPANPQQVILLKVMPAFFGFISLSIPAGVNIYFLVSALFRIAQTAAMYRFDPTLSAHAKKHAREIEAKAVEVKPPKGGSKPGGRPPAKKPAQKPTSGQPAGKGKAPGRNGVTPKGSRAIDGNGRRPPARSPQKRRSKKGR